MDRDEECHDDDYTDNDCPRCGGSGGGPDERLHCPLCRGTGRRPEEGYGLRRREDDDEP